MNLHATTNRTRFAWFGLAGLVFVLLALTLALALGIASHGSASVAASLWPGFEMTYNYQVFSVDGRIVADETHHLSVSNEYSWRDEILADRVNPEAAGSFREFKDGVLTSYNAKLKDTKQFPAEQGAIIVVNEFLNAALLPSVKAGRAGGGWSDVAQSADSVNATQRTLGRCPDSDPPRQCVEEVRLEWAATSLAAPYKGGIVIRGERVLDGTILARLEAVSFEMAH
jgi:hypothetical protein